MTTLRYIFIAMIFGGLVLAEAVPLWSKLASPAHSERQLSSAEQNLIMSILNSPATDTTSGANQIGTNFFDFKFPSNPGDIAGDAIRATGLITGASNLTPINPTTPTSTAVLGDILQSVIPPLGSDLYYKYQDGGKAWYSRGNNVLVISPDETITSFDTKTGKQTTWLQDRLAYPPIADPTAYSSYQTTYHAEIVAETTQWVLMEFPSGGVVKVMKPQYTKATAGGNGTTNTIYGLPNILPGYGP